MRDGSLYDLHGAAILETMRQRRCSLSVAAGLHGLNPKRVHRWMEEAGESDESVYAPFAAEVRRLRAEQIEAAEVLHEEARAGTGPASHAALSWWLQRMAPEQYGEPVSAANRVVVELPDASPEDVARALGRGDR